MADFPRIATAGKTEREILEALCAGQAETHECVHRMEEAAKAGILQARKAHVTLARQVGKLNTTVRTVKDDVAALADNQAIDSGRITKLAKMFGAESLQEGEKRPRGRAVATWSSWKLLGAAGGCITAVVFLYQFAAAVAPAIHAFLMGLKP